MLFWINVDECADFSDSQLDTWKSRGVDGFICSSGHLRNMGGTQDWTGNASHSLSGSNYDLQRKFRDTQVITRAKNKGMDMYLGFYLVNYWNEKTPLID